MGRQKIIFNAEPYLFLFETIIAVIVVIFLVKISYIGNNEAKNGLVINDGLIYLEGESVPYSGRVLDTLSNKMIVEFNVVNGLKNGEFFITSLSGKLAAYGFMENNKNDGPWLYFYENGQLECNGNFNNDEPVGNWVWYYKNGVKKCEGIYLNGKPEGKWLKYDNNGYPSLVINYHAGQIITIVEIDKPKMI